MKNFKKLLNLILLLITIGVIFSCSKSNTKTADASTIDRSAAPIITGKVISVNPEAKTFVLLYEHKEYVLSYAKLKKIPVKGAILSYRYFFDNCEDCKSVCPGVCFFEGGLYCRCYLEHLR